MRALELILRLLPLEARSRYREEALADLAELHGARRGGYLLGMLLSAPALRRALHHPRIGLDGHRLRLGCRLGVSHHWHTFRNDDNQPYRRCERCGLDDGRGRQPNDGIAVGASMFRTTG